MIVGAATIVIVGAATIVIETATAIGIETATAIVTVTAIVTGAVDGAARAAATDALKSVRRTRRCAIRMTLSLIRASSRRRFAAATSVRVAARSFSLCYSVIVAGASREKRKRGRRLHERKFVFDWDAGEDTSKDYNKLYQDRHEVQFFGRGSIAGVDVNAQKKEKSAFYQTIMEQRRTDDEKRQEEQRQDTLRKRQKQEDYEGRHWSNKPLEEMQDRDWRIFREDFNIGIKARFTTTPSVIR